MHLKKINKDKNLFSICLFQFRSMDDQNLSHCSECWAGTHSGRGFPSISGCTHPCHIHTHTLTQTEPLRHVIYFMCTSLQCGKKTEYQKDMGRMYKLHKDRGSGKEFFSYQHYNKTLNKMLFENLLYWLMDCGQRFSWDLEETRLEN